LNLVTILVYADTLNFADRFFTILANRDMLLLEGKIRDAY